MSKVVGALKDLLTNNLEIVQNGFFTLFVFGLEALLTAENVFVCPVKGDGNREHGCMFIFVPGLVIFMISFLVNNSFKKNYQGCCYAPKIGHWNSQKNVERFKVFFYSLVAGCLWIFWALVQKKYYTCAKLGNKEHQMKNATSEKQKEELKKDFLKAETTSQIYGFTLIALVIGIPLLFLAIRRCFFLEPYTTIPTLSELEKEEEAAAEEKLREKITNHVKTQAQENAEKYFLQTIVKDCIPGKSINDIICKGNSKFSEIPGYKEAMKSLGGDNLRGNALAGKTKEKIEELAKEEVKETLDGENKQKCEYKKPCEFLPRMSVSAMQRSQKA